MINLDERLTNHRNVVEEFFSPSLRPSLGRRSVGGENFFTRIPYEEKTKWIQEIYPKFVNFLRPQRVSFDRFQNFKKFTKIVLDFLGQILEMLRVY